MAKKAVNHFSPDEASKTSSAYLRSMIDSARSHFNDPTIVTGGEAERFAIGVPLPGLSLEYLLQSNVLQLGFITQLVGQEGSMKSGFAAEMGRWFMEYNHGLVSWMEHESKLSVDWLPSIVGWHNEDKLAIQRCNSINEWQSCLMYHTKQHKALWDFGPPRPDGRKGRGPGPVYPVLLVVDSVMGKSLQESQDKIERAGFADRAHPAEAGSITKFLRAFPQQLMGWPMHLVLINQLKMSTTPQGLPKRDKAGGQAKEFQESIELQLAGIGKTQEYETLFRKDLEIRCYKNSLGATDRRIPVAVKWWNERLPGFEVTEETDHIPLRQTTVFDWDEAAIQLLLNLIAKKHANGKKAQDCLDLTKVSKGELVWSRTLGIPKTSPLQYTDAGKVLHANVAVMRDLREAWGIKRHQVMPVWSRFDELFAGLRLKKGEALKILRR